MKYKPFSRLAKKEKLRQALDRFQLATSADAQWQQHAAEDFAFVAGNQWTTTEKSILSQENRPAFVWNFIKANIDLVMGLLDQNRVRAAPYPIERSDQLLCDVLDEVINVVDSEQNFDQKADEAFYDAITCGRGYIAIDFMPDPKRYGQITFQISSVPVYEIHLDPSGINDDLSDHAYIFREKWLSIEDFRAAYPEAARSIDDLLQYGDDISIEEKLEPNETASIFSDDQSTDQDVSDYSKPLDVNFYGTKRDKIRVIHMEYWETFQRYYALNPLTGKTEEIPESSLELFKEQFPGIEIDVIQDRKVKWLQFCKDKILFDGDSPLPFEGFSIIPCFGYKDKSQKTISHFGIVSILKDPQREVNKRWSQALNLLVNQGQGIMAEVDAFVDVNQAEQTWNDPRRITWITKGAVSQGKIQEKPGIVFPAAAMQMQEMAHEAMKHISGINPDLLGFDRGRQEAGVVVRLRQQQGLTLLSRLFNSYKEMLKVAFLLKASIVMKYMPDAQISQIIGMSSRYAIQNGAIIDTVAANQIQQLQQSQQQPPPIPTDIPVVMAQLRDLRDLRYNVKIDETPGNMTKEMLELSVYMEMMGRNFPVDPKMVIEKMNLPGKQKARWMQYIDSQMQSQSQMVQMNAQMQMQMAQANLQLEQAKVQLEQARLQMEQQIQATKLQLEQFKAQQEARINEMKVAIQAQKAGADVRSAERKAMLTAQRIAGDQQIAQAELIQQAKKDELQAALKSKAILSEEKRHREELDVRDRATTLDAIAKLRRQGTEAEEPLPQTPLPGT